METQMRNSKLVKSTTQQTLHDRKRGKHWIQRLAIERKLQLGQLRQEKQFPRSCRLAVSLRSHADGREGSGGICLQLRMIMDFFSTA